MSLEVKGCRELQRDVLARDFCSLCGACVGMCPYLVTHKGRVVALQECDLPQGRCYAFCPRTATDLDRVSDAVFGTPYDAGAIGTIKEVLMARATADAARRNTQHGGTLSALTSFALERGLIDSVILSDAGDVAGGVLVREPGRVVDSVPSKNVVTPGLSAFNRETKRGDIHAVAVVGLPCQVLALAKMRASPLENRNNIDKLKLTIGQFCRFLRRECIVCLDLTAELSDISVGSEGLTGWDILIVRNERGMEVVDAARAAKVIEVEALPDQHLKHLEEASRRKRKTALRNIRNVSGSGDDLLYLVLSREARGRLLAGS